MTFYLSGFRGDDKEAFVTCTAGDLRLTVDCDDVDHHETAHLLRKMLAVLNDHWDDPAYIHLATPPKPDTDGMADDEADDAWVKQYKEAMKLLRGLLATRGMEST